MAFNAETKKAIESYVTAHIPDERWHRDFFSFVRNSVLAESKCAFKMGFIEEWLQGELVEFYEARNAIHIHAEIRKSLDYQIDLSRRAYLRMEPFRDQVSAQLISRGLLPR